MSVDVEKMHKKISNIALGDLCLLCGQAINNKIDDRTVEILLKYLEIAIGKEYLRRIRIKPTTPDKEVSE